MVNDRKQFIEGLRAAERIANRFGYARQVLFPSQSRACYQVAAAIRCRIRREKRK